MSELPVAVQSISWDGYLVIGSRASGDGQCRAMAVRPQLINATAHAVDFPPASFSDGVACPTQLGPHALVPDSDVERNPYRSDAGGNADPDGDHLTYALRIFEHDAAPALAMRRAQVVVANPMTAQAEVVSLEFTGDGESLLTTNGDPLHGINPTVTADGRLMIFQGHPQNDTQTNQLVYSRREASGWTHPRSVTELFGEGEVLVDGIPLNQRYPLAQQRLRVPDGRMYPHGFPFQGAHPWISRDGTELFFTATEAGLADENGERARQGGMSVVGRATGYTVQHIDGAINPSREGLTETVTLRQFQTSPGMAGGFRTPYRDTAPVLAADADAPVYPMFGLVSNGTDAFGSYNEVELGVFADRDYLMYLPMNESLMPTMQGELVYEPTQTPDISGNFNTGILENGARFAVEQFGLQPDSDIPVRDENTGARGRAIYFSEQGRVRVPPSWGLQRPQLALTVQAYVQPLEDLGSARHLVTWPGSLELVLEQNGMIRATVFVEGQPRTSGPVGPALQLDEWTHVASTYDAITGTLRTYIDGELVDESVFDPGRTDDPTDGVLVGPAGLGEGSVPADQAVLALDEVALSRVARSPEAIARAAGTFEPTLPDLANQSLLALIDLPLGLDSAELLVPADNPVSEEAVELGRMLFFDPRLSANGEISCATCHDPALAWTDGLATGLGIDDQVLTRNTPTILNRAFSTNQFWGGRAATVEEQALGPIVSPAEMGNNIWDLLEFLRSVPEYVELFENAYGEGPTQDNVANAIASFERTVVAGNSPVDRFEAGDTSALTEAEQRGREVFRNEGRCIACHSGSNFTDEKFHMTGLVPLSDTDFGRFIPTKLTADLHAYKTPSLRNIAETGPYFHDGSAATLEEVVALYNQGSTLPDHDWEIRPLDLTEQQQADLVAFLEALTDPTVTTFEPPTTLPGQE